MIRKFLFASLMLCAACDDTGMSPIENADDTIDQPTCDVVIETTFPAAGASDAYYRGPIEFHLSAPDETAVVNADVPGETTFRNDGHTVVFTPYEPLEPLTRYSATLEYCGGAPTIGFSTSALGLPLEIPFLDFVGRTYVVDVTAGRFLAGEGIADVAASVFTRQMLISVVNTTEDEFDLRLALAEPKGDQVEQDVCTRTLDLPPANLKFAPFMHFGADTVAFNTDEGSVALADVSLDGTIAPDGSRIGGAAFSATIDAVDIVDAYGIGDVATMCMFADSLGVPCGTCPDGDGDTCVTLQADDITALEVPGLTVERVDTANSFEHCITE